MAKYPPRSFNGRWYGCDGQVKTKRKANDMASTNRREYNQNTRIIKVKNGYRVYSARRR